MCVRVCEYVEYLLQASNQGIRFSSNIREMSSSMHRIKAIDYWLVSFREFINHMEQDLSELTTLGPWKESVDLVDDNKH